MLISLAILATSCGGATTPTSPSPQPTPSVSPTPSPAPDPNSSATQHLSGTIVDDDTRGPLEGVQIMAWVGLDVRNVVTDANGFYDIPSMKRGELKMRLTRDGYSPFDITTLLWDEEKVINTSLRRICARPDLPRNVSAAVSGNTVSFTWSSVPDAVEYRLVVSRRNNPEVVHNITTTGLSHEWTGAPSGDYEAKVQARNASCGWGGNVTPVPITVP